MNYNKVFQSLSRLLGTGNPCISALRVLLCSFLFVFSVKAQVTRLYTLEQGLQSSYIRSLYVDRSNMLWISTTQSLELFDGHLFHTINYSDPITGKLLFNEAKSIRQMDEHHFMIMTNAGLFEYDISTNHFTRIKLAADEPQLGYPVTRCSTFQRRILSSFLPMDWAFL